MPLKGGSIWIKKTTNEEIEDILKKILADSETIIELLRENAHDPHYVYKLQFNNTKFSKFFEVTGNSVSPRVLIIKILIHYAKYNKGVIIDPKEHDFEVDIHKQLSLSTINHYPICPSFLHSKQTKLGKMKPGSLEEAIHNKLTNTGDEVVNLYTRLTHNTIQKLFEKTPALETAGFTFPDTTQTIIFMEYTDCISLDRVDYMSNIHGMSLPFQGDSNTKKAACISFVLLYMATLLLKEGIIHGDLHAGNVLVCYDNEDDRIDAVVIDFGRSAYTRDVYIRKRDITLYEYILPDEIISIFEDATRQIEDVTRQISFPSDTDFVNADMSDYFNGLIDEQEYVKAATSSTMFYSPAEHKNNENMSHFDYYADGIKPYAGIFEYTNPNLLKYDFKELITEALKYRKSHKTKFVYTDNFSSHGIPTSSRGIPTYGLQEEDKSDWRGLEITPSYRLKVENARGRAKRTANATKVMGDIVAARGLLNELPSHLVNVEDVKAWIVIQTPKITKEVADQLIELWLKQKRRKPNLGNIALAESAARDKKKNKSSFVTRARASVSNMFSIKPKVSIKQRVTELPPQEGDGDLMAGGKGIRQRFYNYKRTRKGRVNKIYSKKIYTKIITRRKRKTKVR